MKKFLVILLIVFPAALAFSDTSPVLEFYEDDFNFGTIIVGDKVKHDFVFRNGAPDTTNILDISTSCGCTAGTTGKKEFTSGETGSIHVEFDSRGKHGHITKTIRITTDKNETTQKTLRIFANVVNSDTPESVHPMAKHDQTIFSENCRGCHYYAANGKKSRDLYNTVCAMCHGNYEHFVIEGAPALTSSLFIKNIDGDTLKAMISKGTNSPMMPGFGVEKGGPLSTLQITSLVDYFESIKNILPVDIPPPRPPDFKSRMKE